MLKNYFLIKKITSELNKKISKNQIKQVFTEIKNELVFELDNGFLQIGLHRDLPFMLFRKEYHRKNQSMTILAQLEGEMIKQVLLINNKRIIEIKTDKFFIVLNLFHGAAGLALYDSQKLLLQKIKTDPSPLYFQENLNSNHFHQLLKKELEKQNIDKIELLKKIEKSETLYLYRLQDRDILSLIELKQFNQEPEYLSNIDFLESYRRLLYKMMNRLRRDNLYHQIDKTIFQHEKKIKSTLSTLKNLDLDQEKKRKLEEFGHLIMANLNKIETGDSILITANLFSEKGEEVKIPLKTKLSAQENAQVYYQKAKQFDLNKHTIEARLVAAEKKMSELNNFKSKLVEAGQIKDLDKLRKELIRVGYLPGESNKDKRLIQNPINTAIHFSIDNYDVYVGKSAENNDYLSMKFAKANDYWFHVHGSPGSHVILRWHTEKKDPPKDLLKKIASLTAFYSKQKNAGTVSVVFTQAKYVRKPKGAKPGTVTITKEKSILVKPKAYEELV